ncbi:sensor histidine kinase [Phytohabitans rumicis]|uniref:Histidine kinase/HSP90-like ATPase domain-containing protein n=1 Tax=Phytohabitans rumicis TaxID=1076125 RepID=A0A6V8KU65_9ACTN|nr:sensor histidine kinase [Phytohabitans rumicis]GFJ87374.1 hypothetical protein Prum_010160 [Phytohabitans rumicis]
MHDSRRIPTVAAAAVVAVAVAASVTAAILDAGVDPAHRAALGQEPGWVAGIPGLGLAIPGALLLRGRPRHPVAWVLCIIGVHWTVDGVAASWLAYATASDPVLPGAGPASWLYDRLGAALLLSLPLVLLLYPDGRLPAGYWRVASLVSLAATALLPVTLLFVPADIVQAQSGDPLPDALRLVDRDLTPLPLPDAVWPPLLRVAYAAIPLSLLVPFAVVVRRYRAAAGADRASMRWLVWAGVVDVLVMLSSAVAPETWTSAGLSIGIALTGIAITIGIVKPDLLDIDRLLGATLRYGGLAVAVVLVDVAVVGATGAVLGEQLAERDAALTALLVVTAVYGPLRHRLWRAIRRLVLGRRDDPYGVVAGLAEQLERSGSPEDQLLAVARTVAEAFRSPYVSVEVDRSGGERLTVEHGTRPAATHALPITYRGEEVGRLVLPRGGARAPLSIRDERLLGDVVRQAAAATRASYLAIALQRSREQIVNAREEERRRLRRDLHDGLGPSLGAVAMRIDTARNLAATAPQEADRLLRQARDEVAAALTDVRRLVHDLRPPALDDLGLVGAVQQQTERLRTPGLTVRVDAHPDLAGLPAAVEVAAYRIASEALTNVARHAGATTCRVRIAIQDSHLLLEVADDGSGIGPGTRAGVGLVSLRERAAELGGQCEILCPAGRGTLVRARLPLGDRAQAVEVTGA